MNDGIIIKKFLEEIGLQDKSIRIYIFLLNFGPQPVSVIAKKIKAKRSSCYGYIGKLKEKGFVAENIQNGVTFITPTKFEYILNRFEEEIYNNYEKRKNQIKYLRNIETKLDQRKVKIDRPEIKVFTGKEALRSIYEISLTGKYIMAYFSASYDLEDQLVDDWHTKERTRKEIPIKILLPETIEGLEFASVKKLSKEVKTISKHKFPFHGVTLITDKNILMYSADDKIGVSIKSEYLSNNQAKIFDLIWDLTKNSYE